MIDTGVEADDAEVVLIRNDPDAVYGVVNDLREEFNRAPLKRKGGKARTGLRTRTRKVLVILM